MSAKSTPIRNPLREINCMNNTPDKQNHATPQKNLLRTPKMSPGPALLHAMRLSLSAKKDSVVKPISLELVEEKEIKSDVTSNSNVKYFRDLIVSHTKRITSMCEKWDYLLTELSTGQESDDKYNSIMGDIRTTVGQGRLIMRERFHQFTGLADNCEFHTSEKPVTCQDLQGFWDMIYFQVEDVDSKFLKLDKCREANWDPAVLVETTKEYTTTTQVKRKKVIKKASVKPSAAAQSRKEEFARKRADARKRLAAAKAAMKQPPADKKDECSVQNEKERVTFDAGFFKIDSPVKSPHPKLLTPSGSSLRKQVTTPSNLKQSYSPCPARVTPNPTSQTKADGSDIKVPGLEKEQEIEVTKKLEFGADAAEDCRDNETRKAQETYKGNPVPNITVFEISNSDILVVDIDNLDAKADAICNDSCNVHGSEISRLRDIDQVNTPISESKCSSVSPYKQLPSPTLETGIDIPFENAPISILPPAPFDSTLIENTAQGAGSIEMQYVVEMDSFNVNQEKNVEPNKISVEDEYSVPIIFDPSTLEDIEQCTDASDAANISLFFIEEASKNISEKVSEILCTSKRVSQHGIVMNDSPYAIIGKHERNLDEGTSTTPSLGNKTKSDTSRMQETLEKILLQHQVLQKNVAALQENNMNNLKSSEKSEFVKELQSRLEDMGAENSSLRSKLKEEAQTKSEYNLNDSEELRKLLFKPADSLIQPADETGYKPHYYRVLAQTKVLKAELKAFQNLKADLDRVKKKMAIAFTKFTEKTKNIEKYSKDVKIKETELEETKRQENLELRKAKSNIEKLTFELGALKKNLEESESFRMEETSSREILEQDLFSTKNLLEISEIEVSRLDRENADLNKEKNTLEEKLESITANLMNETEKSEKLESKITTIRNEIPTAFASFEAEIKKRDDIISSQSKQQNEIEQTNIKLSAERDLLRDQVETLEYVEDERESLQEQLTETEQLLENSKKEESKLSSTIKELDSKIGSLEQVLSDQRVDLESLQEKLDVTKVESQLVIFEKEEELSHANSGMKDVLELMHALYSRLSELIVSEVQCTEQDMKVFKTPLKSAESFSLINTVLRAQQTTEKIHKKNIKKELPAMDLVNGHQDSSSAENSAENEEALSAKNLSSLDNITLNIGKGINLFQTIMKACESVRVQFQEQIKELSFKNSVLNKQMETMKDKLFDIKDTENELEKRLRERIIRLAREIDEKDAKIVANAGSIKKLSDQIVELLQYKIQYEQSQNEMRGSRRGRYIKRRSSSAGSLKVLH